MGRALVEALDEQPELKLTGALASNASRALDADVGELCGKSPTGIRVTNDRRRALAGAQVAVDFTLANAVPENVRACVELGVPLVIGTTGLDQRTRMLLDDASRRIAVLCSPNMSIGVNVLLQLVDAAARALGSDYDAEILDVHHRQKRDAPSGTALKLGETIANARGDSFDAVAVRARIGEHGPRRPGEIGFAVVRAGEHVGEHTVMFSGNDETVTLSHRASDRRTFARGALRAAAWLSRQPAGRYGMSDVMG
jgi:4-hydroxy-tetrahydrodipicolinate reductase